MVQTPTVFAIHGAYPQHLGFRQSLPEWRGGTGRLTT